MAEPAPTPTTAHEYARALAAVGLRVLPIKAGHKRPPMNSWQHAATDDITKIDNWYQGLYRDAGTGLALGPQPNGTYLFAIDIDTHDPAHDGWEALADLEAEHGPLPDTWRSLTGAGGGHLIFRVPPGVQVRNQQASGNRIAAGIDVRGDGGQIVVAPTVHPDTQRQYAWEIDHAPWERPVAEAPAWLIELVRERPVAPDLDRVPLDTRTRLEPTHTDSIAAQVRQWWDWHHELAARGWTLDRTDGADTYWVRPGKDPRHGHSAVLHSDDVLVVFTTEIPDAWRVAGVRTRDGSGYSFSPFGFVAAVDHAGDRSAAARALRTGSTAAQGVAAAEPDELAASEDPDDQLRALLIDWPEFWAQDHGDAEWIAEPILPAKRSVALFAPGGTGKSLLSLWIAANLAVGRDPFSGRRIPPLNVLYLDYEMTHDDLAERLEQMGYGADCDLSRLHYALLPSLPGLDQPEGGKAVVRLAEIVEADLVVIDTFGRAVHGDENEADTVRAWYRWTGLHLKHAGRAFLRVDHAGKDITKGQRGTSAKNDDVDVVWQMTVQEDRTFKLTAKKRRMGWVPEVVKVALIENDLLKFGLLDGDTWPTGTKEVAAALDDLGIDASDSARKASKALREAGRGARDVVVRAAQKYRKQRSATLHFVGDDPTAESVSTASRGFGTRSEDAERDAAGDADGDQYANPQQDTPGTRFGTRPDAPSAASGSVRRSIERTRPAEPEATDDIGLF